MSLIQESRLRKYFFCLATQKGKKPRQFEEKRVSFGTFFHSITLGVNGFTRQIHAYGFIKNQILLNTQLHTEFFLRKTSANREREHFNVAYKGNQRKLDSFLLPVSIPTHSIFQPPSLYKDEEQSTEMSAGVSSVSPRTHTYRALLFCFIWSIRKGTSLRGELCHQHSSDQSSLCHSCIK